MNSIGSSGHRIRDPQLRYVVVVVYRGKIPILEEASENVKEPAQPQYRMSPTYKLKVDEIDFNTEKKQWPPEPEIEVIEEEKPEYDANAKEKEMF